MHKFVKLFFIACSFGTLSLSAMDPAAPNQDAGPTQGNSHKRPRSQQTPAPAPEVPHNQDVIILLDHANENSQSPSRALTNTLAVALHQKAAPIIVSANVLNNFLERKRNQSTPSIRDTFINTLQSLKTLATPNNCTLRNAIADMHRALINGTLTEQSPQGYPENITAAVKNILKEYNKNFLKTPRINDNAYTFVEFDAQHWHIFKHNTQDLYLFYPHTMPNQHIPGFNLHALHEISFMKLIPLLLQNNRMCNWEFSTLTDFFIPHQTEIRWHVYLLGHGSSPSVTGNHRYRHQDIMIAGLPLNKFQNLLELLHTQLNTAFLYYISCNSGGYNLEQVRQHMEQLQQATGRITFTLAAGALTDAPAICTSFNLWNFHVANNRLVFDPSIRFTDFFNGLHAIFSAGTPDQPNQLKDILRAIILRENITQDPAYIYNTPSILLPTATCFHLVPVDSGIEHINPNQTLGDQVISIQNNKRALLLDTDILTRPLYLDQETMPRLISATIKGTHTITSIDASQVTLEDFLIQAFGRQEALVTPKKFTINALDCLNYPLSNLPPFHAGGFRVKELIISKKKGANEPWKASFTRGAHTFQAYFNNKKKRIPWNCHDLDKQLLTALAKNNYPDVQTLLAKGASVNAHVHAYGLSPASWTQTANLALDDDYAYTQLLPKTDPALMPEHFRQLSTERPSISLMFFAIMNDDQQLASLLLNHNPDLESGDRAGLTPLHVAALCGNVAIGQLLLNHARNLVNMQDEQGDTPLHKVLNLLIQCEQEHNTIITTMLAPNPYIVLSAQKKSLVKFLQFLRNNNAHFILANNAGQTPSQLLLELHTLQRPQQPMPVPAP